MIKWRVSKTPGTTGLCMESVCKIRGLSCVKHDSPVRLPAHNRSLHLPITLELQYGDLYTRLSKIGNSES